MCALGAPEDRAQDNFTSLDSRIKKRTGAATSPSKASCP